MPQGGPATGELEVYRAPWPDVAAVPTRGLPPDVGSVGAADGDAKGLRGGVERWSRWAAGLGLPPRDASGARRHPARERVLPPAVWVTVALALAAVGGLLTGVLVSGGNSGTATSGSVVTATVTVTNATTAPAVTTTTTRTRTRTVTASPTATEAPSQAQSSRAAQSSQGRQTTQARQGLGPGSQGPQVFALQLSLAQLGLYRGAPNGNYDWQTQAAVQNFQARAGITADPPGIAGPITLQAINQALGR